MPTLPAWDGNVVLAPHVVILGAGASAAAYDHWGRLGRPLPLMNNLVDVLSLTKLIKDAGINPQQNFETLYGSVLASDQLAGLREEIEARVYEYFSSLCIPDKPTIYDYLVLSLRDKDIIASFNWDPFLLQAYVRSRRFSGAKLPRLAFLHDNVMVGLCKEHRVSGRNGNACSQCGNILTPSKLLYPVDKKDYNADAFINGEWAALKAALKHAYLVTIFGYSAPHSDVEARQLMLEVWNQNETKTLAEVEIVDIRPRVELERSWQDFYVSHHYGITESIFETLSFRYPRRSCDAFAASTLMMNPWHDNFFPKFDDVAELQQWIAPLVAEERAYDETRAQFSGSPIAPNVVT